MYDENEHFLHKTDKMISTENSNNKCCIACEKMKSSAMYSQLSNILL